MSASATLKGENGQNAEATGLSVLDVVKHSVNTIINTLDAGDKLSLVRFSSRGEVVLPLTAMDDDGKEKARSALKALNPTGSTNLWDGLVQGLDHMQSRSGKNAHLLLLTDGEPTDHPQGGYGPALKKRQAATPLGCSISTFGFGYVLDSPLLVELATLGNGKYYFIPDSGLVGTVFVNCLSNILCAYANEVQVSIKTNNTINGDISGFDSKKEKDSININIGSVNYGQSRDLIVNFNKEIDSSQISVVVRYLPVDQTSTVEASSSVVTTDDEKMQIQTCRVALIDVLKKIMDKSAGPSGEAEKIVNNLIADFTKLNLSDTYAGDLLKDAEGQVYEAISKHDYYTKWGRHYLPSLRFAHLFQQCNNFKDPGVQHYGGDLFFELRDQIDEIFLKIPPPVPSKSSSGYGGSYGASSSSLSASSSAPSAPVNMNAYYNAYGG